VNRAAARLIVRVAAWLVPAGARDRWREEWLGEIESSSAARVSAAARGSSPRPPSLLRRASGAPRDAWHLRRALRRGVVAHRMSRRRPHLGTGLGGEALLALRHIAASPGHSAMTAASLALGLGVSIGMFAFVNALFFADLPGVVDRRTISRVVIQQRMDLGAAHLLVSRRQFATLAAAAPAGFDLVGRGTATLPITVAGESDEAEAVFVSGNYFAALGTTPLAGRLLTPADDRRDADVAVIDTTIWRDRFGASLDMRGMTLALGGRIVRIVGVVPAGFTGWSANVEIDAAEVPQVWVALGAAQSWPHLAPDAALHLALAARHSPVVSDAEAVAALSSALPAYAAASARPQDAARLSVSVRPVTQPEESASETALEVFLVMLAPLTVLAIACANVANLRLSQATGRLRDLAVRLSLGGSRWRIMRPIVIESLLLATAASGAGLLGARAVLTAVEPLLLPVSLDWRVAGFVLACAFGVVLISGLGPAWRVTGQLAASDLRHSPQSAGSRHGRLRNALVVLQVALSLTLLTVGALSVRAVWQQHARLAGPVDELLVAEVDLEPADGTPRDAAVLASEIVATLRSDTRIQDIATGDRSPFRGVGAAAILAHPSIGSVAVDVRTVSPRWFSVFDQPLVAGRLPAEADRDKSVIVINQVVADRLGGARAALGQIVEARIVRSGFAVPEAGAGSASPPTAPARVPLQVIGVVAEGLRRPGSRFPSRVAYLPGGAMDTVSFAVVIRTARPAAVARDVRRAIDSLSPRQPLVRIETMAAIVAREMSPWRLLATGLGSLGGIALVLAATGLFAMLAYAVSLRTREIGVRMAVGARSSDVLRLVLGQATRVVVMGTVAGLAVTLPVSFAMNSMLPGISPVDPVAFGSVAVLLVLTGALAALIPARRAARIDPVRALRAD
jgi:predicted permease